MVQINFASREVSCKIVYYGPGRCGKTTNLQVVHAKAPPTSTGEMISIATKGDRTLYFDFLSLDLGTVAGMRTRFHLYTVPGQVYYDQTRKLVLQGSDGIVFVADSARGMMAENIESLDNLVKNLHENGLDIKDIPVVLQWNKRDLPDAMPVDELDKTLNRHHWPTFEATAVKGHGVFQTLKGIAQQVIRKLNREQGFSDDGHSRKADAKLISVPPPPPPPISAPQAPHSQVAPPSVPKASPTGGPEAMPAALRPPTIQPRSAPAAKPAAPPRVAPPPPSAQQPVPAPVAPAHPPPKPVAPPSKPATPPPPPAKPAALAPAKPAAPPPAKPAAPPPLHVIPPASTTTPVPEFEPSPDSEPALRSAFKTFKVSHYPPLPEDMEEGDAAAAPSATPAPPIAVPTAPSVSTGPKSSGSVKSVLLLVGLLALAGAAIAAYQFLIRK